MKIAILGTGTIGSALAEVFLKDGFEVFVYNRTPSRTAPLEKMGAVPVDTPAQAITAADATILAVIDSSAVKEILFEENTVSILNGKKLLNVATMSAHEVKAIAKSVFEAGGNLAEVAIRSDAVDVRKSAAYALLACDFSEKAFWENIFTNIGKVDYVGELGIASSVVIPGIMGSALQAVYLAYTVAFAQKANIPQEIIAQDVATFAPGAEQVIPQLWEHDYSHGFATLDGYRDTTKIALGELKSIGLPTTIFEDIIALYDSASKKGYGNTGESALIEALIDSSAES